MAKALWQPVTVSLLGVNSACDSPPQGQARLCNHRLRKSLRRPKASSYSRRGLTPHPDSHVGCIVPLGSDTEPALDGNLPIHTVAAHKGGVFISVVNKGYSATRGRNAALPWRSCIGTLGSRLSSFLEARTPSAPNHLNYDSSPKHRA